jgi:hypothetical protein
MFSKRALIPVFLFSPLLAFVVFLSAKNMYTSALIVEPTNAMERWACMGRVDDLSKWESSKQKLEKANILQRDDADIVSELGRLHEFKALSLPAWNPQARDSRGKAINYYKQAIKKRPTWALAWLNLAQSKILSQKTDEEAFDAIRNGFRFGRWQEKVQQRLLWLSIGIWPVLPEDIKITVRNIVVKTLEQDVHVDMLLVMAFRFGWQEELRALMENKDHLALLDRFKENPALIKQLTVQKSIRPDC